MTQKHQHYISYLVRLWSVMEGGELLWRGSLESPRTQERRGFADLSSLCTFLEGEVRQAMEGRAVQNANDSPSSRENLTRSANESPSKKNQRAAPDRQAHQGA